MSSAALHRYISQDRELPLSYHIISYHIIVEVRADVRELKFELNLELKLELKLALKLELKLVLKLLLKTDISPTKCFKLAFRLRVTYPYPDLISEAVDISS